MKTSLNNPSRLGQPEGGVLLIEALISVLILALGILGLVALQASMNTNATEAKYRAEASFLANDFVGLMWTDQRNLSKYAIASGTCSNSYTPCSDWLGKVGKMLPNGSATVVVNGVSVTVTVSWQTPGSGTPHNYVLMSSVIS